MLVIYLFGITWYGVMKTVYLAEEIKAYTLFVSLFLVFLPGDVLKNLAAAFAAKRFREILPKIINS